MYLERQYQLDKIDSPAFKRCTCHLSDAYKVQQGKMGILMTKVEEVKGRIVTNRPKMKRVVTLATAVCCHRTRPLHDCTPKSFARTAVTHGRTCT